MTNPFQQLVDDHRHLRQLLRFLRDEVDRYDDAMQETDIALVVEALDYMSNYPQAFHHPLEEAAFDYMAERDIGDDEVVATIREQHRELERETTELARLFDMIYNDHIVPVDRIKSALNKYLDLQFRHIETEDEEIFPVFEQELSDRDWKAIAGRVTEKHDPLFHTPQLETYGRLSRNLGLQ